MAKFRPVLVMRISLLVCSFTFIHATPSEDTLGTIINRKPVRVALGTSFELPCNGKVSSESVNISWSKIDDPVDATKSENFHKIHDNTSNELSFENVRRQDNGTYECRVTYSNRTTIITKTDLIVKEKPEIKLLLAKAVMVDRIYFKWTVNDHNDPVKGYLISYNMNDTNWLYFSETIGGGNTSYVVDCKDLQKGKPYKVKILATNSMGKSNLEWKNGIVPLEKDFPLNTSMKKNDNGSITISWSMPPIVAEDLKDFYYYEVKLTSEKNETVVSHSNETQNHISIRLEPATYQFKVRACIKCTKQCSPDWNAESNFDTKNDGIIIKTRSIKNPINVSVMMKSEEIVIAGLTLCSVYLLFSSL